MHGQANYRGYAAGNLSRTPAWLWGKLFDSGQGYPLLRIPKHHCYRLGSTDYLNDAQQCHQFQQQSFEIPRQQEEWFPVWGELLVFDDPLQRIPRLDDFEDYEPQKPSLYDRVLSSVIAMDPHGKPHAHMAWVYVQGSAAPKHFLDKVIAKWPVQKI